MEIRQGINYLFARNGQQFGPVDGDRLIEMARAGEVVSSDHLWTDGMVDWLPAPTFSPLSDLFEAEERKRQEELKKQAELRQQAEIKRQEDAKKLAEQRRLEEQKRVEELKRQEEKKREEERKRQEELERQERLRQKGKEIRARYPITRFFWMPCLLLLAGIFTGIFFFFEQQEANASSYVIQSVDSLTTPADTSGSGFSGYQFGQLVAAGLAVLALLGYLVASLIIVHRAWHYMQDVPNVATTPTKAAALLTVPLVNLKWVDTAYKKWNSEFRRKCRKDRLEEVPKMKDWLFGMNTFFLILFAPLTHFLLSAEMNKAVHFLAESAVQKELEEFEKSDA